MLLDDIFVSISICTMHESRKDACISTLVDHLRHLRHHAFGDSLHHPLSPHPPLPPAAIHCQETRADQVEWRTELRVRREGSGRRGITAGWGAEPPLDPLRGGEATWHPISRDGIAVDDSQFRQLVIPELEFGKARHLSPNTTGLGEIPNADPGGALSSASPGSKTPRG